MCSSFRKCSYCGHYIHANCDVASVWKCPKCNYVNGLRIVQPEDK